MRALFRTLTIPPGLFVLALTLPAPAQSQQSGDAMVNMQEIAQGLGVQCSYCHAGMGQAQQARTDNPSGVLPQTPSRVTIARAMIAMTRELNTQILAATGKPASETTRVTCITCHRGVAIPVQLSDIITKTALQKGPDAAVAQYRELRAQYYGHQSYDFGEDTLLTAGQQIARAKPAASIPVLRLNIEFYPRSVQSYSQIAFAYTRSLDDEAAISTLEKALEIEPDNGVIKGQIEQLKSYRRRK